MLKGLAITPPVLGRISIGKVIERNGANSKPSWTRIPWQPGQ